MLTPTLGTLADRHALLPHSPTVFTIKRNFFARSGRRAPFSGERPPGNGDRHRERPSPGNPSDTAAA